MILTFYFVLKLTSYSMGGNKYIMGCSCGVSNNICREDIFNFPPEQNDVRTASSGSVSVL